MFAMAYHVPTTLQHTQLNTQFKYIIHNFANPSHGNFHWTCYTPEIHQIAKLKFLGTDSNSTKISSYTIVHN